MSEQSARYELLASMGGRPLSTLLKDQEPGFLFDGCFRDRSITVFIAPAHRGKTLLMLDMALCLDLELPLFGRFKPQKNQEVFFLGCDAPSWDMGGQTRKLLNGHGIPEAQHDLISINGVWRRGFKITDHDVQDQLKAWRDLTGASVLFIDTHRATHRANENASGEMEAVWDILCGMRESGWAIIMSHHTSKPSEVLSEDVNAARGSTVIGASADFIYTLNKRSRLDNRVMVKCVKARGSGSDKDPFDHFYIQPSPETAAVRLVTDSDFDPLVMLLKFLEQPRTRTEMMTHLQQVCSMVTKDMTEDQVYRLVDNRINDLRRAGKITSVDRGIWRIL